MVFTVDLTDDIIAQLTAIAIARGQSDQDAAQDLLVENIERAYQDVMGLELSKINQAARALPPLARKQLSRDLGITVDVVEGIN